MRWIGLALLTIVVLCIGGYYWNEYQYRSHNGHRAMQRCQEIAEYEFRHDDLPITFNDWSLWGDHTDEGQTWVFHGYHGDDVFECFISFYPRGDFRTADIETNRFKFLLQP